MCESCNAVFYYYADKLCFKLASIFRYQKGFLNWKDAAIILKRHTSSACHCEAVKVVITLLATTKDVVELLSIAHQQEKQQNREILLNNLLC